MTIEPPQPTTDAVLQLKSVSKQYPGCPPIHALREVNLVINSGELVAICGPSGSGKSTLMNMIGTLDRPTSGQIHIGGQATDAMTDRQITALRSRQIGFVFQGFHLIEGLTAAENVAVGLCYSGTPRRQRTRNAESALRQVGLGHRIHQKPGQLSGGERQRVAIARALVGDPSIVLADEPTGNLDQRTGLEIVRLLRKLHTDGATIVVITHDEHLSESFPRRLRVLDGQIHNDSGQRAIRQP